MHIPHEVNEQVIQLLMWGVPLWLGVTTAVMMPGTPLKRLLSGILGPFAGCGCVFLPAHAIDNRFFSLVIAAFALLLTMQVISKIAKGAENQMLLSRSRDG